MSGSGQKSQQAGSQAMDADASARIKKLGKSKTMPRSMTMNAAMAKAADKGHSRNASNSGQPAEAPAVMTSAPGSHQRVQSSDYFAKPQTQSNAVRPTNPVSPSHVLHVGQSAVSSRSGDSTAGPF